MTAFRFKALDAAGLKKSGVLDADSERSARAALRDRGWFPLQVQDVATGQLGSLRGWRRRRVGTTDLCLLTRQWATLLLSGLTMEQALSTMIEQAESEGLRDVLAGLRREILGGASLHVALDKFSDEFPAIYRASVAAGEKSGEISRVMLQLADHLERGEALRRKTMQALIYPAILVSAALLVIIVLMTYVVPSIVSVFQQGKHALPWLTRALIAVSALLRNWGWLLAVIVVAVPFALRQALQDESLRLRWDNALLRLPGIGKYLLALDATRFASTLAILAGSGVPLLEALEACGKVVARRPLALAIGQVALQVREGMPLSRALQQTHRFPPILTHMIASGEATGQLGEALDRAAQLQQTGIEVRTAVFTSLIEPIMLLVMGGLVLLIVLAVMQPIIEMNVLIH